MKKTILLAALLVAAMTVSFAQENQTKNGKKENEESNWHGTRIGREYQTDYGLTLGYGGQCMAFNGNFVFDVNAAHQNYRTRFMLGGVERWYWPQLSVDAQWLLPFCDGFYFFPSVGVRGELHNIESWKNAYYAQHTDEVRDPEAKWGRGSWGIGAQLGGGLEYQINSHIALFAEGRYYLMYNSVNNWNVNAGIIMNFSKGRPVKDEYNE